MSTRFSQWRNTEYVGLPVESYLQAGLVKDQRIDTELQKTSAALAEYKSLQALGANAEAYQNEIMSGIKTQLEDLAKGNLKSPEALMKMQSIVTNPTYINGLKQIAKSTEYFKIAQKAASDYKKESGNDINSAPFYQAYKELMDETGDASKFNPNRFAGMDSFPKYIEVQEKINSIVKEMKPNTMVWSSKDGGYRRINSIEELTDERIRDAVQYELRNRKDLQTQFARNIQYDALQRGSNISDMGLGIKEEYKGQANELESQLSIYKQDPIGYAKKLKLDPKKLAIQAANTEAQIAQLKQLAELDPEAAVNYKYSNDIATGASKLYAYKKDDFSEKADAFQLQQNAFANQRQRDAQAAAEQAALVNGNTAMVNLGIVMGDSAETAEADIKSGEYLRQLAQSTGIDIEQYMPNVPGGKSFMTQLGNTFGFNETNLSQDGFMKALGNELGFKPSSSKAPYVNANKQKEFIKELAKKWGYNPKINGENNETAFLQNLRRSGEHLGKGVVNLNFDAKRINAALGNMSEITVLENGEKVTSTETKQKFLNYLTNAGNETNGVNFSESGVPLITFKFGEVFANYREPGTNKMISYQLPNDLAKGLQGVKEIMEVAKDRSYGVGINNRPVSVFVPEQSTTTGANGISQYTGARVANGSSALTMFKNAGNKYSREKGKSIIKEVAQAIADKPLDQYNEKETISLYNQAIKYINDKYNSNINLGENGLPVIDRSSGTSNIINVKKSGNAQNIVLDNHYYIINNGITTLADLENLHVGMAEEKLIPSGKGFIRIGGTDTENNVLTRAVKAGAETLIKPGTYQPIKPAIIEDTWSFGQF